MGKKDKANSKLKRKVYEKEILKLQVELVRLQSWVKQEKKKIVIIFEGRDAAGKGGVIKRITERVSPRVFRVVALPAPTEREKTQLYLQRYISHLPAGGEVVIFDRSWYNRAGVERVMGFCTEAQYTEFMHNCPNFERALVRADIILIKYFFDVSAKEQQRRFEARINDPLRQWKLSGIDLDSIGRWWDYSEAFNDMFRHTDIDEAPWYIVKSDDKRRARLNCIAHLLSIIPYETRDFDTPDLPKRPAKPKDFDDHPTYRHAVPENY